MSNGTIFPSPTAGLAASQGFVLSADNAGAGTSLQETGVPVSGSAGGDLSGTYPNPTVATIGGQTPVTTSTTLGGDLSGSLPNPSVAKVAGVAITGTPTAGQVPVASSGSAAAWGSVAAGFPQSAVASVTSGDLTTSSTTFVDATGLTVTLTTGAHRCLVVFSASVKNNTATFNTCWDVAIDGTRQGQAYGLGLIGQPSGSSNTAAPTGLVFLTGVLSAGSHTIKVQWRVDGGTGTMFASTTVTPAILTVIETGLAV